MPGIPISRRSRPPEDHELADPPELAVPAGEKPAGASGKPRRARDGAGRLVADDPATPDVNEAYEPTPVPEAQPES